MRVKLLLLLLLTAPLLAQPAPAPPPFRVEETTIAQIRGAMKAGRLTCRALGDAYLRRIDAYDKNGPSLNAIVMVNPDARAFADELDRRFAHSGLTGPLHCIPAILKDNFGRIGRGGDTGNSIRGPSSHQALAGIRSPMGLTSRAGVVPLSLLADIAGPMTRTLTDAVTVFQVIAGEDADDPATAATHGRPIPNYALSLERDGLKGARIGVLRQAYERETTDPAVVDVFMAAIEDLKRAGATIVDPARVELTGVRRPEGGGQCGGFKYDINRYLEAQGDRIAVHTLEEIIRSHRFHPSIEPRLQSAQNRAENGPDTAACKAQADYREQFRAAVTKTMDASRLDGFVYPTWSNPPRLIRDLNTPHGDNSHVFSPTTGWPALT